MLTYYKNSRNQNVWVFNGRIITGIYTAKNKSLINCCFEVNSQEYTMNYLKRIIKHINSGQPIFIMAAGYITQMTLSDIMKLPDYLVDNLQNPYDRIELLNAINL